MPFSADGSFKRAIDLHAHAGDQRKITAAVIEEEFSNLATGLSGTLRLDGSVGMTGPLQVAPATIDASSITCGNVGIAFSDRTMKVMLANEPVIVASDQGTSFANSAKVHDRLRDGDFFVEIAHGRDAGIVRSYCGDLEDYAPLILWGSKLAMMTKGGERVAIDDDSVRITKAGNDLLAIDSTGSIHMAIGQAIGAGSGYLGNQGVGQGTLTLLREGVTELASTAQIDLKVGSKVALKAVPGYVEIGMGLRATGAGSWPNAGAGVEMEFTGGCGYVSAVDRTVMAMAPLALRGEKITFHVGGSEAVSMSPTGLAVTSDIILGGVSLLDRIASLEARLAVLGG